MPSESYTDHIYSHVYAVLLILAFNLITLIIFITMSDSEIF